MTFASAQIKNNLLATLFVDNFTSFYNSTTVLGPQTKCRLPLHSVSDYRCLNITALGHRDGCAS